jgi:hypothetical protein
MRKLILVSAAVIVIGGVGAGVVVTKAGAKTDTEALIMALNDPAPGPDMAPAGPALRHEEADPDDAALALIDPPPGPAEADPMMLAQNSPPAPPAAGPGMPPPPPPPRPGMDGRPGWARGPMEAWQHRPMWHHAAMFGLFFRPADKQLTPADVQKIAEAFLLWQGNRDWKVTQVSAGADGKIGFAFATADGGVIARFTMDSKTGRLARVG